MNQKSTIDSIFKNGLQGMEPPGADDGWQRLEQPLAEQNQAQERGRKRRVAAWLLGMVALLGGGALLWTNLYNGTGVDKAKPYANNAPVSAVPSTTPVAAKEPQPEQPAQAPTVMDKRMADTDAGDRMRPASARPMVVQQNGTARFRLGDAVAAGADDSQQKTARKTVRRLQQKGRQRLAIKPAETGSETVAATTETPTQPDIGAATEQAAAPPNETTAATDPAVPPSETTTATDPAAPQQPTVANETPPTPKQPATASTADRQKKQAKSPVQIELAAGIDISTGLGNPGKYAAMMVRLPLNKKANLLTGIGFATNRLTTGYTRADKQNLLNSPIDATLRGLTMLQFPLLYEQPIKEQKLLLRAGLMPIYILDASIVNVSNGFTGNPNNFRTFTLGDIHRFNVLFSAGLHYRFTPRLGIELRANYGLTELVKNSYINQSGENNNLKSAQVGLLLMLGRKR